MAFTKAHAIVPFVTTHEVDRMLGGDDRGRKQRGRMTSAHGTAVLPEPRDFGRVKRQNLLMLPRFAFGGLLQVKDVGSARVVIEAALDVVHSECFSDLGGAVKESARRSLAERWSFEAVVHGAGELAPDAMRACADLVADAEERLERDLGISFQAAFAVLESHAGGDAHLRMAGGVKRRVKHEAVFVEKDAVPVVHERLGWRGAAIELVMPTAFALSKDLLDGLPDRDYLELAGWFAAQTAPGSSTARVILDEEGSAVDEYEAPRWTRKRHIAQPLHMTRVPHTA